MVHQELGPMLFGGDGIGMLGRHALDNLEGGDVELEAAGCARVGSDFAGDAHGGLLRQVPPLLEDLRRDRALRDDALDDPGAVAQERKQQLAALTQVVEPTLDHHFLADVLCDVANLNHRCQRSSPPRNVGPRRLSGSLPSFLSPAARVPGCSTPARNPLARVRREMRDSQCGSRAWSAPSQSHRQMASSDHP